MTKEQIIQELEQMPESVLVKVLELARTLELAEKEKFEEKWPNVLAHIQVALAPKNEEVEQPNEEVWQAYLASKKEREEVYRRLANS